MTVHPIKSGGNGSAEDIIGDIPVSLRRNKEAPKAESPVVQPADPPVQPAAASSAQPAADPFADLSKLRLDQSFIETSGVRKILTAVPVHKPDKQRFIRVNPDPDYRAQFALIKVREDRDEIYLLTPDVAPHLVGEYVMATVFTVIDRQGNLSLWPVNLPSPDGRISAWQRSASEAAERGMHEWIRVVANTTVGAYEILVTRGNIPEPEWPSVQFNELMRIAFRDRFITSLDHPLVKRLLGYV